MKPWAPVRRLLETDAVVHVATLTADGAPHVVPVWVDLHGEDDLTFFTLGGSPKDRHISRDPRVAFSVTDPAEPLSMASVRGEVVERIEGEAAMEVVDRISRVYTGEPYGERSGFVAFVVRPTSWWSNDFSDD